MSRYKRLFLLAGYDKGGIVDDALIYHVRTLAQYGDVIVCMDNGSHRNEIKKISKYTIVTLATRHGEYDFGSYKRCLQYAIHKELLDKYQYVYLVNDSVFGPMFNMKKMLIKMEKRQDSAVGLVRAQHETHAYMESWFIRLDNTIFLSDWFREFLYSVKREEYKYMVTVKYEHGLTNLIQEHGCSWSGIFDVHGRKTYNDPKYLFENGCPFVKKMSFTRHNGALGKQIKYILNNSDPIAAKSVMATANRLYGERYMKRFLTSNPLRILYRNITYGIKKLIHGGI